MKSKRNQEAQRLFDFLASLTQGEDLAAQMRKYLVDHVGELALLHYEQPQLSLSGVRNAKHTKVVQMPNMDSGSPSDALLNVLMSACHHGATGELLEKLNQIEVLLMSRSDAVSVADILLESLTEKADDADAADDARQWTPRLVGGVR